MNDHVEVPFGLGAIEQPLVPVGDVERAAAFYRDVLGIRYRFGFPTTWR